MSPAARIYRFRVVGGSLWLFALVIAASLANWKLGESLDRPIEQSLVVLACIVAARVRGSESRELGEYLRQLPLGRRADLYEVHRAACVWVVGLGAAVVAVEASGVACWILRGLAGAMGNDELVVPYRRREFFALLHYLTWPLASFWACDLAIGAVRRRGLSLAGYAPHAAGAATAAALLAVPYASAWGADQLGWIDDGDWTAWGAGSGLLYLPLGLALAARVRARLADTQLEDLPRREQT